MAKDPIRGYVPPVLFNIERNKKEKPEKRSAKNKKEVQQMLGQMKEKNGCLDCGGNFPWYVLDFDHVRGKKVANIGQMLDYFSIEDILKEVAKCDIVCSNCHRHRTYIRKHNIQ